MYVCLCASEARRWGRHALSTFSSPLRFVDWGVLGRCLSRHVALQPRPSFSLFLPESAYGAALSLFHSPPAFCPQSSCLVLHWRGVEVAGRANRHGRYRRRSRLSCRLVAACAPMLATQSSSSSTRRPPYARILDWVITGVGSRWYAAPWVNLPRAPRALPAPRVNASAPTVPPKPSFLLSSCRRHAARSPGPGQQ